jgi:hypothetical protein
MDQPQKQAHNINNYNAVSNFIQIQKFNNHSKNVMSNLETKKNTIGSGAITNS